MTEPEKNKIQEEAIPEVHSAPENVTDAKEPVENSQDPKDGTSDTPEKEGKDVSKPVFDARKNLPGNSSKQAQEEPQPMVRILFVLLIIGIFASYMMWSNTKSAPITYGFFLEQLEKDNIEKIVVNANKISGEFRTEPIAPNEALAKKAFFKKPADKKDGKSESNAETKSVSESDTDAKVDEKDTESVAVSEKPTKKNTPEVKPAVENETVTEAEKKVESAVSEKSAKAPKTAKNGKKVLLPKRFTTTLPSLLEAGGPLDQKIREKVGDKYNVRESLDMVGYMMLLSIIITIILIGSIWYQFRRARDQFGAGGMGGFTKSLVKRFQGGEGAVTFKDVAGLKGVKEDLTEIVDFLKNSQKFERLGARIPKGVLMSGPPGTGKTLLARAIAGEAGVPFYSINASEFIQMFVGVGASRVRDMFEVARAHAPSILFIDEIDAIGRYRGTGTGGGNDEREQTLNQILGEMDGFATSDLVIVIAATNRPDVLDPALLRPGRFDRRVTVDRPVQKDRVQLFNVHTRRVPLADGVDFDRLASMTTGLTGADIRNIVNEAALWACRQNHDKVDMNDFYYSIDKVLMGAKREEVISDEAKEKTSYHEAGHTLVSWLTPDCDRVSKVSVIPRGHALGVTWSIPEEDRLMYSQREIMARLKMMLGGREAERLVFDELNAGAANDLERATEIVRKMVASWGMSPRLGPATFNSSEEHPFLGKQMAMPNNFSEKTAQIIDEEIMRILNEVSQQVETLLSEHRNMLDALAQALVIREELDEAQIEEILGPPAYRRKKPTTDETEGNLEK
ncbi:MAG: ATP-dependent zinc metalloprotease FtsH [Planctomycetia bacterium]|nr:ATP-dependent zinc metalloprotease FtsH [Planctomycetia bacterium]